MEFPTEYCVLPAGYSVEPDDGSREARADNGIMIVQRLYPETRYDITFRIGPMPADAVTNLRAFYATNRNDIDEWTDPFTGTNYSIVMLGEPRVVQVIGKLAVVEVRMDGSLA